MVLQSKKYPDLHYLGQMQGGMLLFRNNKPVKGAACLFCFLLL